MSFANLSANLNLNMQNFASGLRRASSQVKSFSTDFVRTIGGMPDSFDSASNSMKKFARNLKGEMNDASDAVKELNKNTDEYGFTIKSVSKIVSGIIISQTFYTIADSIRDSISAVWEFSKALEYAQISYTNLFGDISLANEFINVLKDFAAVTPFTFAESEKAAKRLLAYGIEYKNVMYVMQGVLAAASAQGDPTKIESISRALGQIYTKGRVMGQEMTQLTEAGIPAWDILIEKLGLTEDQIGQIGDAYIPASEAINALVDGINERFGNILDASSMTITGIISNITDNATMLFSGIFEPVIIIIKSALAEVGETMFSLRDAMETSGIGGVFEALVPESAQATLRQFAANMLALAQAVMRLVIAFGSALKPVLEAAIRLFNVFSPFVTSLINGIAGLTLVITNNATAMKVLTAILAGAAGMWVIYKVKALASAAVVGVINAMSTALRGLSAMLSVALIHPFWALLLTIGGVLIGISGGFGAVSEKVNSFFKSLTQFNGVDPDKILLPSQKERANDLDKFNNKLEGTADAMDDLADSTGKATKAAKGLLSFDEVFKLNEPDESGTGIDTEDLTDIGDLDIGGLGDAYMPEVPDFSQYLDGLLGGLTDMWNTFKDKLTEIIGAAIGGVLGAIVGGKIGGIIGALVGGLVGYLWQKLEEEFNIQPIQQLATVVSTVISAAIGAGLKLVGSTLPTLVDDVFGIGIRTSLGAALKNGLKGGIQGAFVGLVTGMLANALSGWIVQELGLTEQDLKNGGTGQMIGSIIGTLVGLILGGPMGSLVGGAIGQLAGSVLGTIWSTLGETLQGAVIGGAAGLPIGALVGTLVGSIGGPLGAALGALLGTTLGTLVGWIVENWDMITDFFGSVGQSISDMFSGIGESVTEAYDAVASFFSDVGETVSGAFTAIGETISEIWQGIEDTVTTVSNAIWEVIEPIWTDISNGVTTVLSDLWLAVTTVWNDILLAIETVTTTIYNTVSGIFSLMFDLVVMVLSNIWDSVVSLFSPIVDEFTRVCSEVWNSVSLWFTEVFNTISTILSDVWASVSQAFLDIYDTIATALSDTFDEVQSVFSSMFDAVAQVLGDIWTEVYETFTDVYNAISNIIGDALEVVSDTFNSMLDVAGDIASGIWTAVSDGFSNLYDDIKWHIENMYTIVTDGIANMYNAFTDWVADLWNNVFGRFFGWIDDGIEKLREFFGLESEASSSSYSSSSYGGTSISGHAYGGVFNREHIARLNEGNKAEAVIPLENSTAMQPFVDAVANGITASLAPILAVSPVTQTNSEQLRPLYVGTLIADERGLKELARKMEIIQIQEDRR